MWKNVANSDITFVIETFKAIIYNIPVRVLTFGIIDIVEKYIS